MDETEIDLRTLFAVLWRQWRLIAATFVVVLTVTGLALFAITPIFSSSALILYDPSSKNLLEPEPQLTSSASDSARIDSEVELLRSDNILLKVIVAENLLADDEFGVSVGWRSQILGFLRLVDPTPITDDEALGAALAKLQDASMVQRRGLTYLISVQARSARPAMAARLANAIAQTYIAEQLSSKVNSVMSSRDILQARLIEARNAVATSESTFDTFIGDNLTRIAEDTGRTDLIRMQSQIQQLQNARDQSSNTINALNTSIGNGDWSTLVAQLQSDALQALERQRQQVDTALSTTDQGSANAVSLRSDLEAIDDRLREAAEIELTSLGQSIAASKQQEASLREDLRSEVLKSTLSADILMQLYALQQAAELARSQYQILLSRTQDLDTQASLQIADSRIVSAALVPSKPSFPNNLVFLALAGLFGLSIGVGLAFLYEYMIGGFTSDDQVEGVLNVGVAATVPMERVRSEHESLADMVIASPLSVYAESIRRLRATIEQSTQRKDRSTDHQGIVVMVTSTAPDEGKSTVCLALARSFALAGNQTLLIDCDLRKPSIHRHLGIEPSQGLLDFLSIVGESTDIAPMLRSDTLSDATVILGARRSNLPTDQLLSGVKFTRLIEASRRSFDIIVIDTPPIGPVVDGLYVAPQADICVFVAKWASTPQRDATSVVSSLRKAGSADLEIMAVLNQQSQNRASNHRKYGSYYQETS